MKIVDKSINFVSAGKNKSIHTCIHLYILLQTSREKRIQVLVLFPWISALIKYLQVCFVFKLIVFF